MLAGLIWHRQGCGLEPECVQGLCLLSRRNELSVCVCTFIQCVTSGICERMSSEPMKMLSRCVHVRWTSNQMEMTASATDSLPCHEDTSSRKWAMCLEVMRFCSCTWLSSSVSISSSSERSRGTRVRWWGSYWNCMPGCERRWFYIRARQRQDEQKKPCWQKGTVAVTCPCGVELREDFLHPHLLHGLVHNPSHLLLEAVQVQLQQVGQSRALCSGKTVF